MKTSASTRPFRVSSLRLVLRLCAALFVLLCCAGAASAEEETLFHAKTKLFQEGGLPHETRQRVIRRARGLSFEATIVQGLKNQEEEIDISSFRISQSDFASAYWDVLNAHPELFYVDGAISYNYSASGDYVTKCFPSYKYSGTDLEERMATFNKTLNEIVAYASRSSTTIGKLALANDYFCTHFQYDLTYSIYSADELFSKKTGVCQAYMLGYRAVLNQLGISSATVTSDSMNHTWNLVLLDGSWYHIDVTWNDPSNAWLSGHGYFLLSDKEMLNSKHSDWVSPYTATSSYYDSFFWREIDSPLLIRDEKIYYGASRQVLYWPIGGGESISLFSTTDEAVECFGFDGERILYFHYKTVYSNAIDGSNEQAEYLLPYDGLICSSYLSGGSNMTLCYYDFTVSAYKQITVALNLAPQITLSQTQLSLPVGSSTTLTAEAIGFSAEELVWELGDGLSMENGWIRGTKPCITEVTVSLPDGSASAACQVVVYKPSFPIYQFSLAVGDQARIVLQCEPAEAVTSGWKWSTWSEDGASSVAAVDETTGRITALKPGEVWLEAVSRSCPTLSISWALTVTEPETLRLPADCREVLAGAFEGASMARLEADEVLLSIGSNAFRSCPRLEQVVLGASVASIADDAFDSPGNFVILCPENSCAAQYAQAHDLAWLAVD